MTFHPKASTKVCIWLAAILATLPCTCPFRSYLNPEMSGHSRRFPLLDKIKEITNPGLVTALPSVTELIEQVDADGTSGGFSVSIAESQSSAAKCFASGGLARAKRKTSEFLNACRKPGVTHQLKKTQSLKDCWSTKTNIVISVHGPRKFVVQFQPRKIPGTGAFHLNIWESRCMAVGREAIWTAELYPTIAGQCLWKSKRSMQDSPRRGQNIILSGQITSTFDHSITKAEL